MQPQPLAADSATRGQKMKNIAIIPARSGSKGLKDKNIKLLGGKPLLTYTIEAAAASGCFAEIHVSTDSPEYAKIAESFGAAVPFLRAESLAGDTAGSWEVVKMVLDKYEHSGQVFDTVALLQPTSPLRTAGDIRNSYTLLAEKRADMIVAVCAAEHSPLWMNTLPENQSMDGFLDLNRLAGNRQALPVYYRINGALYIGRTEFIRRQTNYYQAGTYAYVMTKNASVDIDDAQDFEWAEYLLAKRENDDRNL